MKLNIKGLKCDSCDYRDDSVQFSEYKENINKPCPKCGNNLLTKKDYISCVKMYNTVDKLNKVFNVLKWFNPCHYYRLIFGDKRKDVVIFRKRF